MKYQTKEEAKTDLFRYIEVFYNRKRFHSTLGFTSPVNFRIQYENFLGQAIQQIFLEQVLMSPPNYQPVLLFRYS
ncbi:MAG: IS3 family transposase [Leptospiraceae bacterium]|nr:IS3 family transposase [Leptospiraceae bacterium]